MYFLTVQGLGVVDGRQNCTSTSEEGTEVARYTKSCLMVGQGAAVAVASVALVALVDTEVLVGCEPSPFFRFFFAGTSLVEVSRVVVTRSDP